MDGVALIGPGLLVVLSKTLKIMKISKQNFVKYFQMDDLIGRSDLEVVFGIRLLLYHKNFKIKSNVVVCSSPWLCIVKNGHIHEGRKVCRKE